MTDPELKALKKECLIQLLFLYKKANAGHIGSSLSCLDILIFLYFNKMNSEDRFVLSKGHAAAAWYTVLWKKGYLTERQLLTFYEEGTLLPAHPPTSGMLNGVIFGTGSLGHGLSLSAGVALAAKLMRTGRRVWCLLSDGDCDEGSTWEAALFAAQHKLDNLTVIIDRNRLQGFGRTEEVLDLEPLAAKWEAFGFKVKEIPDGNNFEGLGSGFDLPGESASGRPCCLIADTVKGAGISFMENRMEWHYLPMDEKQYRQALDEIERKYA